MDHLDHARKRFIMLEGGARIRDAGHPLEIQDVGSGASLRPKREALLNAARRREIGRIVGFLAGSEVESKMHKRQERDQSAARLLTIAGDLYVGKPGKHGFVGYDLRKAMVYAKRALMFEPSCYEALILAGHTVGELDESEGGLQRALDYYRKARRVCPSHPDSYGSEARALSDVGKPELAEQPARKAWRLTLDDPSADDFDIEVACIELSDILVAQKKWKAASRILEAGFKRVPGSDWLRRVLDLTHKKIDWEESTASSVLKRVK